MGPHSMRTRSHLNEKLSREFAIDLVKTQLKTLYSDMSKIDSAFNSICATMHKHNITLSDDDYIRASVEQYLLYTS